MNRSQRVVRRHSSTPFADFRLRPIVVAFVSSFAWAMAPTSFVGSLPSHEASNAFTAFAVLTRSALAASASRHAQVLGAPAGAGRGGRRNRGGTP